VVGLATPFATFDDKIALGDRRYACPAGPGDASAIASRMDPSVGDLVAILGNGETSPNDCAAAKEKLG